MLASIYLQAVIAATMEEVELFLSPLTARSKVREVLRGLVATRQVHSISLGHAPHFYVAGTLPEFASAHALRQLLDVGLAYFLHSRDHDDDEHDTEPQPTKPPSRGASAASAQQTAEAHAPRALPRASPPPAAKPAAARPHFSRPASPLPRPQAGAGLLEQPHRRRRSRRLRAARSADTNGRSARPQPVRWRRYGTTGTATAARSNGSLGHGAHGNGAAVRSARHMA